MQQRKRRMRLLSPTDPVIQRYFTELSAAGGQHYTIPTVTLNPLEEWSVECEFYYTGGNNACLWGFSGNFSGFLEVRTNGSIRLRPTGSFSPDNEVITTTGLFALNKWNHIRLSCNNRVYTITINSLIAVTITSITSDNTASINRLALNASGSAFYNGYVANYKFINNGTLVRHYPLDDDGVTNVARELVSGTNGTRVNLTQASTEMFTKVGDYWGTGYEIDKSIGEPPYLRNLLQWSEDFTKPYWVKVNGADLVFAGIDPVVGNYHEFRATTAVTTTRLSTSNEHADGQPVTINVVIKAHPSNIGGILNLMSGTSFNSLAARTSINLTTFEMGGQTGNLDRGFTELGDGWIHFWLSHDNIDKDSFLVLRDIDSQIKTVCYIAKAWLNKGSEPTSYQKTTVPKVLEIAA